MARGRAAGYDDQRELILARAAALFAQRGYPATSMNEVAQACGLSKATLYHYSRDKYALLVSIAEGHVRKLDMLGRRCTGTYEIFLDNVRVPADRLVGTENAGWDVVLSGLQVERITSAAGNVGAAQAALDLAVDYARERKQFGRPIGSNQAIGHMLADLATEVEAARTLTWRAAWLVSQGKDALREISMAKLLSSETYVKVANQGMQVFGAFGYNMEYDMQRHYRDARSSTIAAGTSQVQRNVIAGLMGLKPQ